MHNEIRTHKCQQTCKSKIIKIQTDYHTPYAVITHRFAQKRPSYICDCGMLPRNRGKLHKSTLIGPALLTLGVLLLIFGQISSTHQTLLPTYTVRKKDVEGPATKDELGRSSWTLIHTMAVNYPKSPTIEERTQATAFFSSLGTLYPCSRCRDHFDRYISVNPPDVSTREKLLLWTCEAHNEVNRRNGKTVFPCTISALDKRWGDCGCNINTLNKKSS